MRRYAVDNWLDAFITLTFKRWPHIESALGKVQSLFRKSRRSHGKFPYVWTIEFTSRIHAHALVPQSQAGQLGVLWQHGFVDRVDLTNVTEIRTSAEYIAKDFEATALRPRYHAARGFSPERIAVAADSSQAFLTESEAQFGMPADSSFTMPGSISARWLPPKTTIEK